MAYLDYNFEGYLGIAKGERMRERDRKELRGKMPIGNDKSSYKKQGAWIYILPCGVPPNEGGVDDDFQHVFSLVLPFQ